MPDDDIAARLHAWADSSGQDWVCAAYDHGPLCRRCTPTTPEVMMAVNLTQSALNAALAEVERLTAPHSRACGWLAHPHGPACHPNCPTCHGEAPDA